MRFAVLLCGASLCLPVTAGFAVGPNLSVLIRAAPSSVVLSSRAAVDKENEEPLSVMFQRAVVWQRAGQYEEALNEYKLILQAAQQCQVAPAQYAEVHVNLGALYLRLKDATQAKVHFETALEHRPDLGTAHVNVAVLNLQELSTVQNKMTGIELLDKAQWHCQQVLALSEEEKGQQEHTVATRLLRDIEKMKTEI